MCTSCVPIVGITSQNPSYQYPLFLTTNVLVIATNGPFPPRIFYQQFRRKPFACTMFFGILEGLIGSILFIYRWQRPTQIGRWLHKVVPSYFLVWSRSVDGSLGWHRSHRSGERESPTVDCSDGEHDKQGGYGTGHYPSSFDVWCSVQINKAYKSFRRIDSASADLCTQTCCDDTMMSTRTRL